MVYAYSEKFILSLSHDEFVHEKGTLFEKMPGDDALKLANMRAALGFMMVHPGKKLLFMGQEFGQKREWSEERELYWALLAEEPNKAMQDYMKALIEVYKQNTALFENDYNPDGFEWINTLEWEKNMISFVRRGKAKKDCLLVICNFSALAYEDHQIGVPYPGKYKEIFNSDKEIFGGSGVINPRIKMSKKAECDDRVNSITVKVAPLSISIFKYSKAEPKAADNKTAKSKKTASVHKSRNLKKELETKMAQEEKR